MRRDWKAELASDVSTAERYPHPRGLRHPRGAGGRRRHGDAVPRTRWSRSRLSGEGERGISHPGCRRGSRHARALPQGAERYAAAKQHLRYPTARASRATQRCPSRGASIPRSTRSRGRHLERDARATRGGRGQRARGPWAPAPLRTRRRSGREHQGEASRAGRDEDRNGVPGAVRWHSRPTAPREAGCSGADGEKGRSRSAGSRLRHVLRAASPDRRIWLTERVEATLLCVSLYKAPNNNCLSLHRSLRET